MTIETEAKLAIGQNGTGSSDFQAIDAAPSPNQELTNDWGGYLFADRNNSNFREIAATLAKIRYDNELIFGNTSLQIVSDSRGENIAAIQMTPRYSLKLYDLDYPELSKDVNTMFQTGLITLDERAKLKEYHQQNLHLKKLHVLFGNYGPNPECLFPVLTPKSFGKTETNISETDKKQKQLEQMKFVADTVRRSTDCILNIKSNKKKGGIKIASLRMNDHGQLKEFDLVDQRLLNNLDPEDQLLNLIKICSYYLGSGIITPEQEKQIIDEFRPAQTVETPLQAPDSNPELDTWVPKFDAGILRGMFDFSQENGHLPSISKIEVWRHPDKGNLLALRIRHPNPLTTLERAGKIAGNVAKGRPENYFLSNPEVIEFAKAHKEFMDENFPGSTFEDAPSMVVQLNGWDPAIIYPTHAVGRKEITDAAKAMVCHIEDFYAYLNTKREAQTPALPENILGAGANANPGNGNNRH